LQATTDQVFASFFGKIAVFSSFWLKNEVEIGSKPPFFGLNDALFYCKLLFLRSLYEN
jgi:hypothetical protein